MAINPKYILASGLDEYFVDKDTGLPLSNGTLTFWEDLNRSTPKDVFTISGSPPSYTYVNLGSTITLNATGNPVDESGNNIVIYYYPYDDDDNVVLYYVECKSEDAVLQFTREAWPNTFVPDLAVQQTDNIPNFIPNGQFLLHNNLPADPDNNYLAGRIRQDVTSIAQGGWNYVCSDHTLGQDYVNFIENYSYVDNPTSSPRYVCRIQCSAPNPGNTKDINVVFNDVNKFASNTQQYTVSFTASTFESADVQVSLRIQHKYGTGGSPSPTFSTQLVNFTITEDVTLFQHTFVFGAYPDNVRGTNNDDVVLLYLALPTDRAFGIDVSDFVLVQGPVDIVTFPQTTDADFIARSMVPPVPSPNGMTLALPIIQTKTGYDYDYSQIGKVYSTVRSTPAFGELLADGSIYKGSAYSSDGIPYARLQNYLFPTNAELPIFGTGSDYVSASSFHTATDSIILSTNKSGVQTVIADGAVATGFTFTTVTLGGVSTDFSSFIYGAGDRLWVSSDAAGYPVNRVQNSAATSGYTVNATPLSSQGEIPGTPVAPQLASVIVTAVPAAGTYFELISPTTAWYIWYRVNGSGSDPAIVDYLPIRLDILSTMDKYDVAYATAASLSGFQVNTIKTVAGSSITAGSYFNFYANGNHYYVWMNLNGTGTDPAVSLATGISVTYQASFSATQVKTAIVSAINRVFYAVPALQGMTIKGWDSTGTVDLDSQYRYAMNRYQISPVSLPHFIGSKQFGTLLSHQHVPLRYSDIGSDVQIEERTANWLAPESEGGTLFTRLISAEGTAQNNVNNISLNYVIKY